MNKKTILLIGVSGLGHPIYQILPELNFKNVSVVYHQNSLAAVNFLKHCSDAGLQTQLLQGDVTNKHSVEKIVGECLREFQQLDAVIALQGSFLQKPPLDYQPEEILELFSTNFYANYYIAQLTLPHLRKTQGSLVFFGVAHSEQFHSQVRTMVYSASKSALLVMMRTLARSEAIHNVRINMISPGLMSHLDEEVYSDMVPMGRLGTPTDLLGAIRYLLSEESRYCTGTNLIISGGWAI